MQKAGPETLRALITLLENEKTFSDGATNNSNSAKSYIDRKKGEGILFTKSNTLWFYIFILPCLFKISNNPI